MSTDSLRATPTQQQAILAHYERVAPLLVQNFPNAPVVVTYYPDGLTSKPTYSHESHDPLPPSIPSTTVTTRSGQHAYPLMAENTILWLVHRGAAGVLSWTPSPRDPQSVGFARILLRPVHGADQLHLKLAMLTLRTALSACSLEAIPVLQGIDDAALFIPFADAPTYEAVRAWLHTLVYHAIAQQPKLLIHEKRPHEQHTVPRIECTVVSNAVGRCSSLPYSLAGYPNLPMVTPFDWSELGTLENGDVTAANAAERLAQGDVFAKLVTSIGQQRFADAVR